MLLFFLYKRWSILVNTMIWEKSLTLIKNIIFQFQSSKYSYETVDFTQPFSSLISQAVYLGYCLRVFPLLWKTIAKLRAKTLPPRQGGDRVLVLGTGGLKTSLLGVLWIFESLEYSSCFQNQYQIEPLATIVKRVFQEGRLLQASVLRARTES